MYRFTLYHPSKGEYLLKNSPIGWEAMPITFTRSETYKSVIMSFLSGLQFVKDGKKYIDELFYTFGSDTEISIKIDIFDARGMAYYPYYKGILNLETIKINQHHTECDIVNGLLELVLKNKEEINIDYESTTDIYGNVFNITRPTFKTIHVDGIKEGATVKGVLPFDLFNWILYSITGQKNCFKSSFFDYLDEESKVNFGAYMVVILGSYFSGNTSKKLSVNLKDCFTSFANIFGLGLGIEYTTISDKKVVIEPIEHFYNEEILCELNAVSDFSTTINTAYLPSSIKVGYSKTNNTQNNPLTDNEYNSFSEYSTPVKLFKSERSYESTLRADGSAMRLAIDGGYTAGKEGTYDNDTFILSCVKNGVNIKDKGTEGFNVASQTGSAINLDLTPLRILLNNYMGIAPLKKYYPEGLLVFQKTAKTAKCETRYFGETESQKDFDAYPINQLQDSILSEYIADFNAPVGRDIVDKLMLNPHGLVKVYNLNRKRYEYGFILEVSTNLLDKTTNWKIQLANEKLYKDFRILASEDQGIIKTVEGQTIRI